MSEITFLELVPGITAVLGGICNRGIIAADGNAVVVDSGIGPAEAMPLRAEARRQAQEGNIALFNTHEHLDHTFGNEIFRNDTIIAQSSVRTILAASGARQVAQFKQNPRMATMAAMVGDINVTLPNVVFDQQLTIYAGGIEIQLIRVGPAHSQGDAIAWLPQQRVLFTGDVLFNDLVPAMPPEGDSMQWIQSLIFMESLGAQHVIPGHGPIETPASLKALRGWLEAAHQRVGNAINAGSDRETIIAQVGASMQADYHRSRDERLSGAIGKIYDDISAHR